MKFFPQAQMQSPPDMCTHALFILPKEKRESKGMGKYFLGLRFGVQGCGSDFAASIIGGDARKSLDSRFTSYRQPPCREGAP